MDYRNAFDALKTIVKNEGIKNGLMRGYWAQNFVWWPWSACYFVAYEKGLEIFRRNNNDNKSSLRVDDDNGGVFGGDAERSNFESSSSSSSLKAVVVFIGRGDGTKTTFRRTRSRRSPRRRARRS